ncbi:MAG TPA: helix-turn-helix transcriptional regulator [Streptosporangiaceae bacterium]
MASQVQQAREALANRLKEIRKDEGLTGRQLAALSGWHFTKISKLEHAVTSPSEDDIRTWCRHCRAEDQVPDLIANLRSIESMYLEWRRQLRAGLKYVQESSVPLYERTHSFRVYESAVIPGLFQTAEYVAAILRIAADLYESGSDIDQAVAARMERQRFLYDRERRFSFVLEEEALRTMIGGRDVMLGQLDRILAVMSLPSVSVGVIPSMMARKIWPGEPFWIFDNHTVRIEITSAHLTITRPQEIALYGSAFEWLQRSALYGAAARDLVARAIAEIAAT